MPGKQKMRAKARALLDNEKVAARVKRDNDMGFTRPYEMYDMDTEQARALTEAQALERARRPKPSSSRRRENVGPMTEDTRRQTRRGVRGKASKFADGGCVRGDGIAMKGKTKGRMV